MMKLRGFSRTMMKAKGSLKVFHDEDDEGKGQLTSPNGDQWLRVMKIEDSPRAPGDSARRMVNSGDSLRMMKLGEPLTMMKAGHC